MPSKRPEPGPPVVLVNALGTTMTTWQRVIDRLSPGPQLITYDRAGLPEVVALDKSDWLDGNSDKATLIDHAAGTDEINAITSYPAVPGVVMVKTPGDWPNGAPFPDIDERWSEAEQLLAEQTGAVRIDAADAGHHLQDEVPDLVTLAIRAVLDAATHGTPVLLDRTAVAVAGGTLDGAVHPPDHEF